MRRDCGVSLDVSSLLVKDELRSNFDRVGKAVPVTKNLHFEFAQGLLA